MRVPFLDVAAAQLELRPELDDAYRRVMDSGWYVLGEELCAFEREFAALCGATHAVGVGNGLDALELGLRACGVGPGDEVIVPALTFIATWLAVERSGATVVPVDVEPATLTIDPSAVAAAISARTAAIVPVYLYGRPAEMDALRALADRHGLLLLVDAAQAHGAAYHGRAASSLGDVAGFSFYPGKNLGGIGDGGALTTGDAVVAGRVRVLRNYGSVAKYQHTELGVNSRLDELQAAFLRVKLRALPRWNRRRTSIADTYGAALADVPDLALPPAASPGTECVWHLYCVRHPRRDALMAHLARRGVDTLVHYPVPPHRSRAFAALGREAGEFPVAEHAAGTLLSLPIGPHLDDRGVAAVVDAVRAFT